MSIGRGTRESKALLRVDDTDSTLASDLRDPDRKEAAIRVEIGHA